MTHRGGFAAATASVKRHGHGWALELARLGWCVFSGGVSGDAGVVVCDGWAALGTRSGLEFEHSSGSGHDRGRR
ncbi:hypothetical protein M0R45_030072 [Rubus argutus]|uniref:MHC class I antigen n=1 Tax=Rubus argutus TaxID=59490 RepID=A0AAW1WAQ2_RUBAR